MPHEKSLIGQADAFAKDVFEHIRSMSADTAGVSRQGYSDLETAVHKYLADIATGFGMEISVDAAGNMWMRYPGEDRSLPALVSGSHSDSVPQGGNYDGLAGVVAALTVAWWMHKIGFTPKRDYVVLAIRNEESSFFGKAYVGSLALMGLLTDADLELKHRDLDLTLGEAIRGQGFDTIPMTQGKPLMDLSTMAAFVELHIEQGPMLDASSDRVGVVTGIRGNFRHKSVQCLGQTAHSGAVDKAYRHDAVMAFAELAHSMENHWQDWLDKGADLVFTMGVANTAPTAAIAIIPGEVNFSIDMRSLHRDTLERFHDLLLAEAKRIGDARGISFTFDRLLIAEPGLMDDKVSAKLVDLAKHYDFPFRQLASGAGHDAAVFSNKGVPVGMIFVANQHGSHNYKEAMRLDDFILGTDLLWRMVQHFDS